MKPTLEFWFEFASTYSYLSASRLSRVHEGVEIKFRPFLLGPLFKSQAQWNTSPFLILKQKGANMWRDVERETAALGLPPFKRPHPFPAQSLLAARVGTLGSRTNEDWLVGFTKEVYNAEFQRGENIGDAAVIAKILEGLGVDAKSVIKEASSDSNKANLKANVEEAERKGIYGAPSFVTSDGELFWGNDRLDRALAWAKGDRLGL